jgi:ABC-type Fe3+-hydroxamate transport system substrate-binding protein
LVFTRPPRRIVSLVPSDTLTLFDLGMGDLLVGRTRYCVEPVGKVENIPEVGGTKDIDVDAVCDLAPELILANKEENTRKALETLAQRSWPVFVSYPTRVGDGLAQIARLARILGIVQEPEVKELIRRAYAVLEAPPPEQRLRGFAPIWMDPLMTMTNLTFGSDMLAQVGIDNVFGDRERRYPLAADLGKADPKAVGERDLCYPRIRIEEVVERAPEVILLPDEPHEFSAEDAEVFRGLDIPAARNDAVVFCDGKDLFWHGSRIIEGLPRLRALVAELAARVPA